MATRLYLGNAAAGYAPATKRGAWDDSAASLARRLSPNPEGAAATVTTAETNASAGYDVLLGRWISDPALTAGTLSGTLTWLAGVAETDAAADLFWHVHAYVLAGDSDTVRGTLLANSIGATEWPTTAAGRSEGAKTLASVAVSVGDRLVVEIGYTAQNAAAASYSGTLHYGNTGSADLTAASTNVTSEPGWVEFSGADGLFYPRISTLTDTFDGPAFNVPPWDGSYGAVDITAGRGRVPCAQIGGAPQYAAIYSTPSSQSQRWHFADSAIFCEAPLVPAANGGTSAVYSHFAVTAAATVPGSYAGCFYNAVANVLVLQSTTGYSDGAATYLPYDPVAHRWWRLRHAAGTLYWDTSPDGATWTNRRSLSPAPSWTNYSGLGVLLEAARDSGTSDYAAFDNVNTPTIVVHDAAANLSAASGLSASAVRGTAASTTLSAASALTASAVRGTGAAASFSSASALSATGVATTTASASFSSASTLSASAVGTTTTTASFSAASGLIAAGIVTATTTANFSAASALTAPATVVTSAAAVLSASSTLSASAASDAGATAMLSAASGLSAAALRITSGTAAFSAASELTASASASAFGAALLSAASGWAASVAGQVLASASFSAASGLTASASTTTPGAGIPASPASIVAVRVPVSITRLPSATVARR